MPPRKVGISRGGLGSRNLPPPSDRVTRSQGRNRGGHGTAQPAPPQAPVTPVMNPYAAGTTLSQIVTPPAQRAASSPAPAPRRASTQIEPRPGEDPASFERRRKQREQMSAAQQARRVRMRAAVEAARVATGDEPRRKVPRLEIVDALNVCSARVTRSAIERDEELGNCTHCSRGQTWPMKCHGGDECIECEVRGYTCIRAGRRGLDKTRERQLRGVELWRPHADQCRQCKSRGIQCWMPNMRIPGSCNQCTGAGLECDITPLEVRRCRVCHWEHKCIECARNHLRCDGKTPCFVCVRKGIECVGLKPDGSCPDIPMSTYGTGLPPCPHRTTVLPSNEEKNWPPPSGRLEIPDNGYYPGVPGPSPGPTERPVEGSTPAPPVGLSTSSPFRGGTSSPYGKSSSPFGQQSPSPFKPTPRARGQPPGPGSSAQGQFAQPGPSVQGQAPEPGAHAIDPTKYRTSLYNPFDDDKPPCSHCAADPTNRLCDQGTPCHECFRRGIIEPEDCRTSRPCELCFMNEMPCDAGSPCQNCTFLGFGPEECRPEGISEQRYFPDDNPDDSEDEPYIHIPGAGQVPEFEYGCAFCVAYGIEGCNPKDRPCLPCMQQGRTAMQCRFEERCNRCVELNVPCDGKMPCSLCATADGLTSMMCLGRGDTSLARTNNIVPYEGEGYDIPMGEAGDYPVLAGFGLGLHMGGANNPFAPAEQQQYIDPAALGPPQGIPGQSILPQENVPLVPPGGFFYPPPHVREDLLPHYRVRVDVYNSGRFDPAPGAHVDWRPWTDFYRCRETLEDGLPCLKLPTILCDGGEEHADDNWNVCEWCHKDAETKTAHLMWEIEEKKNLFCCDTCSQAQMIKFRSGTGFENGEMLVDHHCDCDSQIQAWCCYACRYKAVHMVGNRMIKTRELLTRDSDKAILCPRCGVEPGNKEAANTLANGVARCSSCWWWINYAK